MGTKKREILTNNKGYATITKKGKVTSIAMKKNHLEPDNNEHIVRIVIVKEIL